MRTLAPKLNQPECGPPASLLRQRPPLPKHKLWPDAEQTHKLLVLLLDVGVLEPELRMSWPPSTLRSDGRQAPGLCLSNAWPSNCIRSADPLSILSNQGSLPTLIFDCRCGQRAVNYQLADASSLAPVTTGMESGFPVVLVCTKAGDDAHLSKKEPAAHNTTSIDTQSKHIPGNRLYHCLNTGRRDLSRS